MIIATREFDQTSPTPTVRAPAGSKVIGARMSPMGQFLAVLSCPDKDEPEAEYELLFALEDLGQVGGGEPSAWDHVASMVYSGGRDAHLFAKADCGTVKKPRPVKKPKTEPSKKDDSGSLTKSGK